MSVQNSDTPLRMSSYTIPVKLEDEEGKYMLIHGYTGAIDIVSEELLDQIKFPATTDKTNDLLQILINRGYITTRTRSEEQNIVFKISQIMHDRIKALAQNFVIVVTYNCNFRCPYCFEERERKDSSCQVVISKKMVDEIFSAIENLETGKAKRSNIITLYGGEPLMRQNKNIVEYIVKTGKSNGFAFDAITNGYDLDAYIDLLGPGLIETIQITIDGTKEHHNKKRIHITDENTFDKIISNIKIAVSKKVRIIIRVNIDETNESDVESLKLYLENILLLPNDNIRLYASPIVKNSSIKEHDDEELRFITSQQFSKIIKRNTTFKYCKDFGVTQTIYDAMKNKKPIRFRPVYCGAQTGAYVFDAYGNIYPCLETVGNEDRRIGSITRNGINWFEKEVNYWRSYSITGKRCICCKYALFCGGGCLARRLNNDSSSCDYFRLSYPKYVNNAYNSFIRYNNLKYNNNEEKSRK